MGGLLCAIFVTLAVPRLVTLPAPSEGQVDRIPPAAHRMLAARAAKAYEEKRFAESAEIFERLVRDTPRDGRAWAGLGRSRIALGDAERGSASMDRAISIGFENDAEASHEVAVAFARAGKRDQARLWLERALRAGYRNRPKIQSEPDFAGLSHDAAFLALAGVEPEPADRNEGWRRDLDAFVSEVRRLHHRYRVEPLPEGFRSSAENMAAAIPHLTDGQVTVAFQRLAASLGDGHSIFWPFGMKRGALHVVRVRFFIFEEGLFVVDCPPRPELVGHRVLRIGGVSVADAMDRIREYLSHDNEMSALWAAPFYLGIPEFVEAIGGSATTAGFEIEVESRAGERTRLELTADPIDPEKIELKLRPAASDPAAGRPDYLRHLSASWRISRLPGRRAVSVLFNSVADSKDETLAAFARRLKAELEKFRARAVIVDVRNNNGGNADLLRPLLNTLTCWAAVPGRRLYAIVGRQTYSAAQTFVSTLAQRSDVIVAGEPTGSRPNHLGNEALFRLPYSGLKGTLSSGLNQTAPRDARNWIAPDLPAPPTAADFFAGRDAAMEAVLADIDESRSEKR